MCDKSAATPGVCTISYKLSCVTNGLCFNNKLNGCPMPPLAPHTATLTLFYIIYGENRICQIKRNH